MAKKKYVWENAPAMQLADEVRDSASQNAPESTGQQSSTADAGQSPAVQVGPAVQPSAEPLKNVGAKIPYNIYDRLERLKRQSERSGIKADKRNIGDLIAQAIKEFVEKYDVQ